MPAGMRATDYPSGIIHGAYQPLTPPCCGSRRAPRPPSVAGHQRFGHIASHPLNNKKSGLIPSDRKKPLARRHRLQYNSIKANNRAGRRVLPAPHAPMQETEPPTQQNFCAVPIISAFHLIYKGDLPLWVCVLSGCAGITYNLHSPFVRPQKTPTGDGNLPPPRAALLGNISAQTYFYIFL